MARLTSLRALALRTLLSLSLCLGLVPLSTTVALACGTYGGEVTAGERVIIEGRIAERFARWFGPRLRAVESIELDDETFTGVAWVRLEDGSLRTLDLRMTERGWQVGPITR